MDRRHRPFGLSDAMILIAALAMGLHGMRDLWLGQGLDPDPEPSRMKLSRLFFPPSRLLVGVMLAAVATPLTAACLACRLRRRARPGGGPRSSPGPRPRWPAASPLPAG